jgi:hypothetical protein
VRFESACKFKLRTIISAKVLAAVSLSDIFSLTILPYIIPLSFASGFSSINDTFCKTHKAIRMTPAQAAGIESSAWTVEELIKRCGE